MNMQMTAMLIWGLRRWTLEERFNVFAAFFKTPLVFQTSSFPTAHKAAAHATGFSKGSCLFAGHETDKHTQTNTHGAKSRLSWRVDVLTAAAQAATAVGVSHLLLLILGLIYAVEAQRWKKLHANQTPACQLEWRLAPPPFFSSAQRSLMCLHASFCVFSCPATELRWGCKKIDKN